MTKFLSLTFLKLLTKHISTKNFPVFFIHSQYRNLTFKIENKRVGRDFQDIKIDQFAPLFNSNPEVKSNIEEVLNRYEFIKYTNFCVPSTLTIKDMERLLVALKIDEKEFDRTLKYLYDCECHKYKSKRKKVIKKQKIIQKKIEKFGEDYQKLKTGIFNSNGELTYGLWNNSIISRITKQSIHDYRQKNCLRQAALFGQKLIIDLDYDNFMKPSEVNLLAKQIGILYYENRLNRNYPNILPYDIHFTNCRSASRTLEVLSKHIKRINIIKEYFHPESYLELPDLFPKKDLIYLSPHASDALKEYNHDYIYIIGGYNDRNSRRRVSNVKAETEGIKCYRLPLDENVQWKMGNKNLCLNQVVNILHGTKATNSWQLSIRKFVPNRKIYNKEEELLKKEIQLKAIARRMKYIQNDRSINK